jgi:hypothetical protein
MYCSSFYNRTVLVCSIVYDLWDLTRDLHRSLNRSTKAIHSRKHPSIKLLGSITRSIATFFFTWEYYHTSQLSLQHRDRHSSPRSPKEYKEIIPNGAPDSKGTLGDTERSVAGVPYSTQQSWVRSTRTTKTAYKDTAKDSKEELGR